MKHPFSVLKPEYESLMATVQVRRTQLALDAARRLLVNKSRYISVAEKTRVPAIMLLALNERESGGNLKTYLGNGQRLDRVTTLVPKNRGPWPDWEAGAIDAINYDKLNDVSVSAWDMAYACWKGEAWNGFGPRNHGIHTGYLWAGTNHYVRGKYVADGVWDAGHADQQLGMIPVMLAIGKLEPSLAIAKPRLDAPALAPDIPKPAPIGVGGMDRARWIQTALNKLSNAGLLVDGSYGRRTRAAVREWQEAHNVRPFDGLVGPITLAALENALKVKN